MDLKIYRYFYQVAKLGSVREAAEKLHISPSAISRHIKALEQSHDAILFYRSTKGMELTDIGKIIYQYSEMLFNQHRVVLNQINDLKSIGQGSIFYGSIEGVLTSLILPAITKFQEQYPNISFHGSIESTDSTYRLVGENIIDFGIAFEGMEREDVENIASFSTNIIIVTDSKNSILNRDNIKFKELTKYPIATLSDKFYTRQLLQVIEMQEATSLNIKMESDQIDFLKRFVLEKQFLGIFPEFAVIRELETGIFRKIDYQDPRLCNIKTVIIQKRQRFQSYAARVFLKYLMDEIEDKLP